MSMSSAEIMDKMVRLLDGCQVSVWTEDDERIIIGRLGFLPSGCKVSNYLFELKNVSRVEYGESGYAHIEVYQEEEGS